MRNLTQDCGISHRTVWNLTQDSAESHTGLQGTACNPCAITAHCATSQMHTLVKKQQRDSKTHTHNNFVEETNNSPHHHHHHQNHTPLCGCQETLPPLCGSPTLRSTQCAVIVHGLQAVVVEVVSVFGDVVCTCEIPLSSV